MEDFQIGDEVICIDDKTPDFTAFPDRPVNYRKVAHIKQNDHLFIKDISTDKDEQILYFQTYRYWHSAKFFQKNNQKTNKNNERINKN
jgi:hypothetical protein